MGLVEYCVYPVDLNSLFGPVGRHHHMLPCVLAARQRARAQSSLHHPCRLFARLEFFRYRRGRSIERVGEIHPVAVYGEFASWGHVCLCGRRKAETLIAKTINQRVACLFSALEPPTQHFLHLRYRTLILCLPRLARIAGYSLSCTTTCQKHCITCIVSKPPPRSTLTTSPCQQNTPSALQLSSNRTAPSRPHEKQQCMQRGIGL